MTNLRLFLWAGVVIGGGCLWQVLAPLPSVPVKSASSTCPGTVCVQEAPGNIVPDNMIIDGKPDPWFIPVWVTGPDGKTPCLLRFRQYERHVVADLAGTTCPVQDANGRVVAKEGF